LRRYQILVDDDTNSWYVCIAPFDATRSMLSEEVPMLGHKRMQAVEIFNRCCDSGVTDREGIISAIRSEMYSQYADPDRAARDCYRLTLNECPHLLRKGLGHLLGKAAELEVHNPSADEARSERNVEPAGRSKHTSFTLGSHFSEFIEYQVASGRYGSASDVVRAGLRVLEENEARREALVAALIEGEQSGPSTEFDFEAFLARKRRGRSAA
jgi:antitoxin ParD1/3/4